MVLIFGLSISLIQPIFPNFVKEVVGTNEMVSLFYAAMAIAMLLAAILSTVLFSKVERTTIIKWGLIISAVIFFSFIFVNRISELSILQAVKVWVKLFILMALSLFVRDFTKNQNLGQEEGVFYKFHNIGLMAGPVIGGFLAVYYNYEFIFILAALIAFLGYLYFYHQHIIQKHPAIVNRKKTNPQKLLKNISKFFKNPDRAKAYIVTLILMIWFSFKLLYVPLYVVSEGYKASVSGLVLALSILPLILLEVKIGKYADKKGIRIPVVYGFLLQGILLFAIFLNPIAWINFILLILIGIGSAMIEPLQEYYLFKHLPKEEEDELYGIYMTADPLAYFLAPALGALSLYFLPFNYLFLFASVVFFLTGIWASKSLRAPRC